MIGIRHQTVTNPAKLVSNVNSATIDATETTPINHNRHNSTMETTRRTTNPAITTTHLNKATINATTIDLPDELTIMLTITITIDAAVVVVAMDNDEHLKAVENVNLTDNRDRKRLA